MKIALVVPILGGTALAVLFPACDSAPVSIGIHDGGASGSDGAGIVPRANTGTDAAGIAPAANAGSDAADAGGDENDVGTADACAPPVPSCIESCAIGRGYVSQVVNGCLVVDCCGLLDATVDAPLDSTVDGDGAACRSIQEACPVDAGSDAGAGTCSGGHQCILTWSEATQSSAWCSECAGSYRTYVVPDCGGFNLVVTAGTDTEFDYYYDKQTGKLTGIELQAFYIGGRTTTCIAGHVSGVNTVGCADGPYWSPLSCGDAGDGAAE